MLSGTDADCKDAAGEQKGFTAIPNCILASPQIMSLGAPGLRVLLNLYQHLNHKRGNAWPSRETMAKETGMSLRSVGRGLEQVVASGLWERVSGRGGRRVSVYRPAPPVRSAKAGPSEEVRSAKAGPSEEVRSASLGSLMGQNESPDGPGLANQQEENKTKNKKKRGRARRTSDAPLLRALTDRFCELWQQRNGENGQKYPFARAKDARAAKRILDAVGGDLDAVEPIFRRFFDDDSEFHRGHALAKLSADLAKFMVKPTARPRRTGSGRLPLT